MASKEVKRFDVSKLEVNDKKILEDFFERRKIFDEYISNNSVRLFTCPSCGYPTLDKRGEYEICSICNWEDDYQDDSEADEIWGGPNSGLSLTESRLQIGKIFQELSKNLHGTLELNPGLVLKILKDRQSKIRNFSETKITMETEISDPVWKEYNQLKKSSLSVLVRK